MCVLSAYAIYKCYNLVNKINPNISKQSFMRDLSVEPQLEPASYGFDLAFGIGKTLDPSIGYYSASLVYYYYSKN